MLEIYDQIRQPKGNHVLELSRSNGLLVQFNAPGFEDLSADRLVDLGKQSERRWAWAWTPTADEDLEKALSML